jgi:hypothetical protein
MWTTEFSEKGLSRFISVNPFPTGEDGYGHAYCFHGYEAANLFLYTSAWMNFLLCENPVASGLACGLCEGCRAFRQRNTVYFNPVFPRGNTIPIDSIRGLGLLHHRLKEHEFLLIPVYFPFHMQKEAANAFLKLLEEPEPGRIFILVNPGSRMILSTISSRVLHINLPSASAVFSPENPAEGIALRMSDYNFATEIDKTVEILSLENRFSDFIDRAFLLPFQQDDFSGDVFETLVFAQLCAAGVTAGRKMAALCFLSGLCIEEYDYLEDELSGLKNNADRLQRFLFDYGKQVAVDMNSQLVAGYTHHFAGQFSSSDLQTFWRGFMIREMEKFFFCIAQELEFLFLDEQKKSLLPLESFLLLEYAGLKRIKSLSRINSELVNATQMLYNNQPWEQVLENLGLNILQMIKEW